MKSLIRWLFSPLAFANLKHPLRLTISVTDASEEGGAAGEATKLVNTIGAKISRQVEDLLMNKSEEVDL